jgi:hypothetical protein
MRFFLTLLTFTLLLSCNDGDFETPSFNFEDVSIENCGNLILYKINGSETLILELNENNFDNVFFHTEKDNVSYNLTDKIYYRTYEADVPSTLFCNQIPPSIPKLNREWIGSGTLIVKNEITENSDNTFTYIATFTINDMVLTNDNGNSIIYDTYNFGSKTGTFN